MIPPGLFGPAISETNQNGWFLKGDAYSFLLTDVLDQEKADKEKQIEMGMKHYEAHHAKSLMASRVTHPLLPSRETHSLSLEGCQSSHLVLACQLGKELRLPFLASSGSWAVIVCVGIFPGPPPLWTGQLLEEVEKGSLVSIHFLNQ